LHRILVEAAPGVHPGKTSSLGTTRRSAKLLTKDEARRIAANIAKLADMTTVFGDGLRVLSAIKQRQSN
jgi:hypothetical protein